MRAELIALEQLRDDMKAKSSVEMKLAETDTGNYIYHLGRANSYTEAYFRMKHLCEAIREANETNS